MESGGGSSGSGGSLRGGRNEDVDACGGKDDDGLSSGITVDVDEPGLPRNGSGGGGRRRGTFIIS